MAICFLSLPVFSDEANEFNQYLGEYNSHQKKINALNQDIQLLKLESNAQQLKTKLQKDKLECQQFGGCKTKTLYTPLQNQIKGQTTKPGEKLKKKEKRDLELKAVLNKPLPMISSITNDVVSFDNSPQQFKVGDLVYGVWLIESIDATTVKLRNKDNNQVSTVYFYWR